MVGKKLNASDPSLSLSPSFFNAACTMRPKMWWRKFEDEMPTTGCTAYLFLGADGQYWIKHEHEYKYLLSIHHTELEYYTHWMPIVPPEDE